MRIGRQSNGLADSFGNNREDENVPGRLWFPCPDAEITGMNNLVVWLEGRAMDRDKLTVELSMLPEVAARDKPLIRQKETPTNTMD